MRAYAELQSRSPATFVPVHNELVSLMFAKEDFPPTRPECGAIRIPRLSPIVRGVIDRPNFSFNAYMAKQPGGPTEVPPMDRQHLCRISRLRTAASDGKIEFIAGRLARADAAPCAATRTAKKATLAVILERNHS